MSRSYRPFLVFAALVGLAPFADAQLTFDSGNYVALAKQLQQMESYVQQMSKWVGTAEQQLNQVTNIQGAIGSFQNISPGGVGGVFGIGMDIGGTGGIGAGGLSSDISGIMGVGRAVVGLAGSSASLLREINGLPAYSQGVMQRAGLNSGDLSQYLTGSLVHDAFQGMNIEDWQKVVVSPMSSFTHASATISINNAQAQDLRGNDLAAYYAKYYSGLSPAEKIRRQSEMGHAGAAIAASRWNDRQEGNVAAGLKFEVNTAKLKEQAEKSKSLAEAAQVNNALAAERNRIAIANLKQRQEADAVAVQQQAAIAAGQNAEEQRQKVKDSVTNLTP
jgi:hypothetical protein